MKNVHNMCRLCVMKSHTDLSRSYSTTICSIIFFIFLLKCHYKLKSLKYCRNENYASSSQTPCIATFPAHLLKTE
jgi:hypothetical protein